MKILFSWLREYIDGDLEPYTAANALTMAGLEVSSVEGDGDDLVFDIEITPNRADCLSLIGVARELRAIFGLKLKKPYFKIERQLKDEEFKINIVEPELCYRYAARIVRGVKIEPSPDWLKYRLEKSGIRSINNVVDITNYVLLEYGHPLHAFDLDLLKGYCIRVGTPKTISGKDFEEIVTLDGIKRTVSSETLLIWDGERPVAVAGVMGGANTEVTEKTKNILIESAYFKPESIRRTSKRIGLTTEASYRFERGTDIEALTEALDRAAYLIQQIAGGQIYETIDVYPKKIHREDIVFSCDSINSFIGYDFKEEDIIRILDLLDIKVEKKDNKYIAKIPSHRQDLSRQEDIAEEVARIYGYDKIPSELPKCLTPVEENTELTKKRNFLNFIRTSLIALGYSEAINFSFMSPIDLDILLIPDNDRRRKYISLLNPLRAEESVMRTTLIPALIRNVVENTFHGLENIKLFEISKVFIKQSADLPTEPFHLGIITKRENLKSLYNEDVYDFYTVKGIVEGLLNHFKLPSVKFLRSTESFLHPGQSADIYVEGEKIGFIGVVSPKVIAKLDLKIHPYICVSEINLDKVFEFSQDIIKYKNFSNYPPVKRDIALVVDIDFEVERIFEIFRSIKSEIIEDVQVFDVYQGKNIPQGKKSIAFSIVYRAFDRTLKTEEVEKFHNEIIQKIISQTGATLRV